MPDRNQRLKPLAEARKEIEDSLLIMAHLEKRQRERIRKHAEYWTLHEKEIGEHDARMREHGKRMVGLDERIANLVSAIGAMIPKPA